MRLFLVMVLACLFFACGGSESGSAVVPLLPGDGVEIPEPPAERQPKSLYVTTHDDRLFRLDFKDDEYYPGYIHTEIPLGPRGSLTSVALDRDDNILLGEHVTENRNLIVRLPPGGTQTVINDNQLGFIADMEIDQAGNIWVTNMLLEYSYAPGLTRLDPQGSYSHMVYIPHARDNLFCGSLALDGQDHVYLTLASQNRDYVKILRTLRDDGSSAVAVFDYRYVQAFPQDMVYESTGTLLMLEFNRNDTRSMVTRINPDTGQRQPLAELYGRAYRLTADLENQFAYVAMFDDSSIAVIDLKTNKVDYYSVFGVDGPKLVAVCLARD